MHTVLSRRHLIKREQWINNNTGVFQMEKYSKTELEEALKSITSTLDKCEKVLIKLHTGTPQHTLTTRRVKAFRISIALLQRELEAAGIE